MGRGLALAKWIRAIASVARASIPEVAEIEYRIHYARRIAWFNFSGIDDLPWMAGIGIRKVTVGSGCAVVNAGARGYRVEVPGKYALRRNNVMVVGASIVRNCFEIARGFIQREIAIMVAAKACAWSSGVHLVIRVICASHQ